MQASPSSFRVVVATPDVVGERMAGPGIRAWHFASELARHVSVTLIARFENVEPAPFAIAQHGSSEARHALRNAEVLIGQPARDFRKRRRGQRVVYDLFDPLV